ncbi:MAG: PD-(D/E)XK nuclease family protein [Snowella sp.]|nr:PD-(D/E)XK nuclease family protein [Snowella sp.]
MNAPLIRLSQSQLQLLETCPPQFQRLYVDQLGYGIHPEQQEKLTWGSQFHRLMQQRELGLSVDSWGESQGELQRSLKALIEAVPELYAPSPHQWREAEHHRSLSIKNYVLTVIYDLLITTPQQAQILDWKTYLHPQNPNQLMDHWQTKLYLYVLAETTDYLPEQLSMTYWFVKLPTQPQSLTISYSRKQHQQNHQQLESLLTKFAHLLMDYEQNKIPFPHVQTCNEKNCPYYSAFQGSSPPLLSGQRDWLNLMEESEEIALS